MDLAASHLSQEQVCQAKKLDSLLLGPPFGLVKGASEGFGARTPRGPHRIFASCNCKEGRLDQRRLDRGTQLERKSGESPWAWLRRCSQESTHVRTLLPSSPDL